MTTREYFAIFKQAINSGHGLSFAHGRILEMLGLSDLAWESCRFGGFDYEEVKLGIAFQQALNQITTTERVQA